MSAENVFGPVVLLPQIERRVMAHVRKWAPDYVREAERAVEVRADGVTPHQPGTLPLFRSYRPADDVRKWPEDQLPALIFESPGMADGGPRKGGRGQVEAPWVFSLNVVASGRDDASTRWLVGIYTAALRLIFLQHPDVEGLDVLGAAYEDEAYDRIPFQRGRTLMAGTVTHTLTIGNFASAAHGPLAPAADPIPDPGPWPTVQDTDLTLERSLPSA